MLAILATTYFTGVFKMTLVFGVPFLLILAALYGLLLRKSGGQPGPAPVAAASRQRS